MLSVEMTLMPAASSFSTSCQRFSFREPGTFVCASSSTSATCGLRASTRVDVQLLERSSRGSRPRRRGTTSRPPICSAVLRRPCVSTKPDDDVLAVLGAAAALVRASRTSCRRPPQRRGRCGASPRAMPKACPQRTRAVEREVQLEHVRRRARRGSRASVRRCARATRASTSATGRPRARATRAAWMRAFATEMSGSSPEPEAVTASTGTASLGREAVLAPVRVGRARGPSRRSAGFVGPEVRGRARHRVVAVASSRRAAGGSSAAPANALADQAGADDLAVPLDERAVRAAREDELGDAGDDERVGEAGEQR